jgi:molybdopterin biosynthesis enzyme
MIVHAARADALVSVEAGEGEVAAGEEVPFLAI